MSYIFGGFGTGVSDAMDGLDASTCKVVLVLANLDVFWSKESPPTALITAWNFDNKEARQLPFDKCQHRACCGRLEARLLPIWCC